MQFYCTSPIKRKHEVLGGYYYVRCGQCARCVVRRKAIWTGRALCEWNSNGPDGAFCTLTYDDDHVDAASYEDVKLFLKLIRLVYPLRFLAVPDTGDQFGRFHWHLLLFGPQVTPILQDFVQEKWRCGLTDTRPINYERIGYTCGYVTKKIAGETVGRLRSSQFFGRDQLLAICAEYAATFGPITDYPTVLKLGKNDFRSVRRNENTSLTHLGCNLTADRLGTIQSRAMSKTIEPSHSMELSERKNSFSQNEEQQLVLLRGRKSG